MTLGKQVKGQQPKIAGGVRNLPASDPRSLDHPDNQPKIAAFWDTVSRSLANKVYDWVHRGEFIQMSRFEIELLKAQTDAGIMPEGEYGAALVQYVERASQEIEESKPE